MRYKSLVEAISDSTSNGIRKTLSLLILRNFTFEPLCDLVRQLCSKYYGIDVKIDVADLLDISPRIDRGIDNYDIVYLALHYPTNKLLDSENFSYANSKNVSDEVLFFLNKLNENFTGKVLINNFSHDSLDWTVNHTPCDATSYVGSEVLINNTIHSECERFTIVDIKGLAGLFGILDFYDPIKYEKFLYPYHSKHTLIIAEKIANAIYQASTAPLKCIVVDGDNTLWGGVVGEDGIEGIRYQKNSVDPYHQFQMLMKMMSRQGVAVCIASKNNQADVEELFARKDFELSLDDFVIKKINWNPKSVNINEIRKDLNIGFESILFIDDSAFEIGEVKTAHPEIHVLQYPQEQYLSPRFLIDSGLLWRGQITNEDKLRNESFKANNARKDLAESMQTESEYLKSLALTSNLFELTNDNLDRLSQMTQKTNQFNMTTIRMSSEQLSEYIALNGNHVFCADLSDRFGDSGIVAMAMVRVERTTIIFENILVSCRAFARKLEYNFVLSILNVLTPNNQIKQVVFNYSESPKNLPAKQFIKHLGILEPTAVNEFDTNSLVDSLASEIGGIYVN